MAVFFVCVRNSEQTISGLLAGFQDHKKEGADHEQNPLPPVLKPRVITIFTYHA